MGWDGERFSIYATIGGTDVDLIRVATRWPLNDWPKATLTIALGRQARSNKASTIHKLVNTLKVKQKVEVWIRVASLGRLLGLFDLRLLPSEKFLLFEGYTLGPGYARTSSSVEYVIECEHWLADLGYAPATSAASSPGNPSNMVFNALIANPAEVAGGIAKTGGYTGLTDAEEFMTPENIVNDFWGKAIQPYFRALSQLETLVDTDAAAQIGLDLGPVPPGNIPARNAIDRIEPLAPATALAGAALGTVGGLAGGAVGAVAAALAAKKYQFGVPLKFDRGAYGGDMDTVAQQIEIAMGSETLESMAGSTLWDKLVMYASTFMFAIVPTIDRVMIVPFTPGLRTEWKTITAAEYDFVRLSGDSPRVLRGVGIYGGKGMEGGGELSGDDPVPYDLFSVGGYFQGATTGQIKFLQCPMWMADCTLYSESDRSTGAGGLPKSDAISPGLGAIATVPGASTLGLGAAPKPSAKVIANTVLMDKYAEAVYVYEVLKLRSGDMSGRFRLDIAPGSIVKIEGCGEKFLGTEDQFGQTLWATVLQVDVFFDAEGAKAGTAFHLAHVRNALDNVTDGFSLARHPIWTEQWKGAPLTAAVK